MRFKASMVKKLILLITGLTTATILTFPLVKAQSTTTVTNGSTSVTGGNTGSTADEYLYNIMQNTYGILIEVNNLPVYMTTLTNLANAWLNKDDTTQSANIQGTFSNLTNAYLTNTNTRNGIQPTVLINLFRQATPKTMNYANDLAFQTLLGMPYYQQDPRNPPGKKPPPIDPAFNYIMNASGVGLIHTQPADVGWSGSGDAQALYRSYYNTVMAAESFNAYVLSGPYADFKNGDSFTQLQNQLLNQAGSSDWFSHVASETIGVVMRQLLMFQSQAFMLLAQMVQLQKQLLTAQAITNSLLIATAINNEQSLLNNATTKQ